MACLKTQRRINDAIKPGTQLSDLLYLLSAAVSYDIYDTWIAPCVEGHSQYAVQQLFSRGDVHTSPHECQDYTRG